MANKNAIPPEAYKWKPGQSGNPKGSKKGWKPLSYWIQKILNDESFTFQDKKGEVVYQGAPLNAIIGVAIYQSMLGNKDAREWLAKHGYGSKIVVGAEDPVEAALRKLGLWEGEEDAGQNSGTSEKTS